MLVKPPATLGLKGAQQPSWAPRPLRALGLQRAGCLPRGWAAALRWGRPVPWGPGRAGLPRTPGRRAALRHSAGRTGRRASLPCEPPKLGLRTQAGSLPHRSEGGWRPTSLQLLKGAKSQRSAASTPWLAPRRRRLRSCGCWRGSAACSGGRPTHRGSRFSGLSQGYRR